MRDGLRCLVHPASAVSEVDLEATRAMRERLREEIRLREHIAALLSAVPPGDPAVRIAEAQ